VQLFDRYVKDRAQDHEHDANVAHLADLKLCSNALAAAPCIELALASSCVKPLKSPNLRSSQEDPKQRSTRTAAASAASRWSVR
jgi:hypothetical protein